MVDWQAILDAHAARLWRTVYQLVGHHEDALECCQEALLDAHQFALKQPVHEWGALLTTLGTRRAIDRLRQRMSRRKFAVPLADVGEPLVDTGGPVQCAEATDLLEVVRREVAELPAKQAQVFWLVCVVGWSHDEAARELAITTNESRVLVHRAREHLKSKLGLPKKVSKP